MTSWILFSLLVVALIVVVIQRSRMMAPEKLEAKPMWDVDDKQLTRVLMGH